MFLLVKLVVLGVFYDYLMHFYLFEYVELANNYRSHYMILNINIYLMISNRVLKYHLSNTSLLVLE